jgi:hypothetical protein
MSTEIATWYEVKFNLVDGVLKPQHEKLTTGTTLNFSGVEAGTQSEIKCIRIRFSKAIYGLKFWVVNNISGNTTSGGVFDDGWCHGYHIRDGKSVSVTENSTTVKYNSPLLDPKDTKAFNSLYYVENYEAGLKLPFGYEKNGTSTDTNGNIIDDPQGVENYNTFVPIPKNTQVFSTHPDYHQWGRFNENGNFGKTEGNYPETNDELTENADGWVTPYIYLVVNPPLDANGGARTGWGYRISFLYS